MSEVRIGVQLSTIKSKVATLGVYGLFEECAKRGVRVVELSQIAMTPNNIEEIKQAKEDFGIVVCAMSAGIDPMMPGMGGECLANDFDKIVADCRALDCTFLRIGMMPFGLLKATKEQIIAYAERCEEFALRLQAEGIELYYHNHHVEFKKIEGVTILDLLKEHAPHLGFELDIHWIQRGGYNPVDIIHQYAGRIRLLHLKDYRVTSPNLENMFDMSKFMDAFSNVIEFAEVGEGTLDIKGCIEAGIKGGVEYFLIEQDTSYGKDPFDCLSLSKTNLETLGYKDWF